VELRTQRELKSGDGLREALDIVVVSEGGAVRPYETFSGGERTRINLALRIGLARLLSHRRGADSRVLVIDEPEFLDEPGTQALADVLRGLSEFDRIYLVSHVPTLRDAFDTAIVVTKENGRSEIAYPPDRAQTIGVAA
jgi:exonuclease SbcC